MFVRGACVALMLLFACGPPRAQNAIPPQKTLFVFVGQFSKGTFPGWTLVPYASAMESNYMVGGAYDVQFLQLGPAFTFGAELGLAGRFGSSSRGSAEVWGGGSLRHTGIPIGNVLTVKPAVVVGLSAVTSSIGIERNREQAAGGSASLLFYLGPELSFRFAQWPNTEFVFRTHHRSGLSGDLGRMREGTNVNVFGVRIPF
jgi:hypothetical protein